MIPRKDNTKHAIFWKKPENFKEYSLFTNWEDYHFFREEVHLFCPLLDSLKGQDLFALLARLCLWATTFWRDKTSPADSALLEKSLPCEFGVKVRRKNVDVVPLLGVKFFVVQPMKVKFDDGIVDEFPLL